MDDLVGKYNENNWPSSITSVQLQNAQTKQLLKNLKCRLIPGLLSGNREQAVIVFASDNKDMPDHMTSRPGFLMNFNAEALYFIDCAKFHDVPKTLQLVEDIKWDLLLTQPARLLRVIFA